MKNALGVSSWPRLYKVVVLGYWKEFVFGFSERSVVFFFSRGRMSQLQEQM